MLTEALSLYVRALSILQGVLPAVLVECDGVSADRFAAWNPLGANHQQQQQQLQRQQQQQQEQQQQQQQRFGRSSPPSPALLSQRSALVTKASWLKDLFSQTLDRAEHCRTQASVASAAAASAAAAAASASSPAAPSSDSASASTNTNTGSSSSNAFTKDGRTLGPGAPWTTLGGGGGSNSSGGGGGGGSGTPPPPSDAAAAAVYRSAMEHGQEAAVCYLLGRSDAAVTHYVRACALLQLLALEPEMAGAPWEEGGLRGGGGFSGSEVGGAFARGGKGQEQPQQQQQQQQRAAGGWQAQLLATADMYARRVEVISRGDATAERQGFVYEEGSNG
ncbi:unnamed protein product [Laminaria digitata]